MLTTMISMRALVFLVLAVLLPACLWCGWRYASKACDWAAAVLVLFLVFAFYAK